MANLDAPFGFRPIDNLYSSSFTGKTVPCVLVAADNTDTFIGDLVRLSGTAATIETMGGITLPSIEQWAASDTDAFGVIVAFEPLRTNLETKYRVAQTERVAYVVPAAAGQLFVTQCSGSIAVTDIGDSVDVTVGSGNTTTGLSAMEVDSTDLGTGLNLQLMGVYNSPDNDITDTTGTNLRVIVRVNEQALSGVGSVVD